MKDKRLIFALSLALVMMLQSCSIQHVTVGKPKDGKIDNLSLSGIKFIGKIPINNPNNFGFNLKKAKLDVEVNGIYMGCINKKEKIHIKPNSNETYTLNYDASLKDAVKDPVALKNALLKGSPKVKVSGYVKVSKFIVSKKIDVNFEESLGKFKLF